MADHILDAFFVARVQPAAGGTYGGSLLPVCRFQPTGMPVSKIAPSVEAAAAFCFPLGVESVKPSAYLVTAEFSFTLTGGNGGRVHGVCRRTADPTHRPPARAGTEARRWPQVLCLLSPHPWRPFWGKVLEVVEQLLAPHATAEALPPDAPAALFLASLPRLLAGAGPPMPPLGAVVRVPLPYSGAPVSVDRMRRALAPPGSGALLGLTADAIELEVPPDLGNGPTNAGVSLARLLWFLTPRQAVTLVASLLLERRVILVARDADTVSAAVHAANALLYPFRWQHIYLPLLPLALKDYLAAPMPYLVGLQADCLPLLRGMHLEETVMLDLDCLGSCTPPLGSPGDDYFQLPYARELEDVFEVVREHIQSPTEFDSTPKCTELLQDFFLRLVGSYRSFVRTDDGMTPAALALGIDRPVAPQGDRGSRANSTNSRDAEDENPRAHGFLFDQAAFIAAYRRKAKVAAFLAQFRNSQMLEVFFTERLALAAGGYATDDPFERKVAERAARQGGMVRIAGVAQASAAASKGRIGSLLRKAGAAMKQGSGALVASIKQAGVQTAAAEEMQGIGHSQSGPNLARRSPGATVVAHSRGSSFSGSSRMGSRSSSYTNLSRPSANLAALNGGVQPSLEQLHPDMFFGADDDDATSVASESGSEAGRVAATAAVRSSGAPLGAAMSASRSFGALFQHSTSGSYSSPVLSLPPMGAGVGSGPVSLQHSQRAAQQEVDATGAAAACTPSKAAAGAAAGAAVAEGVASKRAAVSPALIDLESPAVEAARWRQKQSAYNHPQGPTPQQLFPSGVAPAVCMAAAAGAGAAVGVAAAAAVQRSSGGSGGGWATFGDAPPAVPVAANAHNTSFGSPVPQTQGIAQAASSPLQLEASVGPLGSGALLGGLVLGGMLSQTSVTAAAAAAGSPRQQQQQQQPGCQQPPPLQQPQQQIPATPFQQPQLQHQPAPQPAPAPPSVLLQGMSSGWAAFGELPGIAEAQASRPALPSVCRDSIHSPLAMGMSAVHRHTSSSGGGGGGPLGSGPLGSGSFAPPRRSSSSGTGTGSGGSIPQSPLSVTRDAFAPLAALAAADASQQMPLQRHRTSSQGGGVSGPLQRQMQQHPQQDPLPPELARGAPWRTTSTSSWAEYEAAPAASTNPFLDPPTQQQQHAQQALARQLTTGGRTTSWGDWSGGTLPSDNCRGKPAGPSVARGNGTDTPAAEFASLRLQ